MDTRHPTDDTSAQPLFNAGFSEDMIETDAPRVSEEERFVVNAPARREYQALDEEKQADESCIESFHHWIFNDPALLTRLRRRSLKIPFTVLNPFKLSPPATLIYERETLRKIHNHTLWQSGSDFANETLWPIVLMTLLMIDSANFSDTKPYGNTVAKFLSGQSKNPLVLSSHFGSDDPKEALYWIAPSLLLLLPIFGTGLLNRMLGNRSTQEVDELKSLLDRDSFQASHHLEQAKFKLLWGGDLGFEKGIELLCGIHIKAKRSKYNLYVKWQASSALADIAYSLKDRYLHAYIFPEAIRMIVRQDDFSFDQTREAYARIRKLANKQLEDLAKDSVIARHHLWRISPHKNKHSLYYIIGFIKFYALLRKWQIIFQKIIQAGLFFAEEHACENQGKIYAYLAQIDEYLCGLCSDWAQGNSNLPSIYYADTDSSQKCLDALFAKPSSLEAITKNLDRFQRHPDFHSIDLSKQNVEQWNDADWDMFLSKVETIFYKNSKPLLEIFNFSRPMLREAALSGVAINRLAMFFQKIPVNSIDLRNQNMGPQNMRLLVPGFQNASTEYLDLSANKIGDTGIESVTAILPAMPKLQTLKLADDEISFQGAIKLAQGVNSTKALKDIDVSGNYLRDEGIQSIVSTAERGVLDSFDFSRMPLSVNSFKEIGKRLRFLRSLRVAEASISDSHIAAMVPYLPSSTVQSWQLSHNNIGDMGISLFFTYIPNTTQIAINVNYNRITDNGLMNVIPFMSTKPIAKFEIAGNYFTDVSFIPFAQSIYKTVLQTLNIGDNNDLGDLSAEALAKSLQNPLCPLRQLNFARTGMQTRGGLKLLSATNTSRLAELSLAGNKLSSGVMTRSNSSFPFLTKLDLSFTQMDFAAIRYLAATLAHNHLQSIILNGNPAIGEQGGMLIAKSLLQNVPELDKLGDKFISRDSKRWVDREARNSSTVREVGLSKSNVGNGTARLFMRGAKPAGIKIKDIHLAGNPIGPREVDINSGYIPAAGHRAQPAVIFKWLHQGTQFLQLGVRTGTAMLAASSGISTFPSSLSGAHSRTQLSPTTENTSLKLVLLLSLISVTTLIYLINRILSACESPQEELHASTAGYQHFGLLGTRRRTASSEQVSLPDISKSFESRKGHIC